MEKKLKETMELLESIEKLLKEVDADSDDGKLTIIEVIGNYKEVLGVINEGKDYKEILAELKELNQEEIITLNEKLISFVFTIISIVKKLS